MIWACKTLISVLSRCTPFNGTNSKVPESCHEFYIDDDISYYNGDMIPGINQALNDVILFINLLINTSDSLDQCGQLIGDYLCHYYFPICNMKGDKIIPVCSSSCNVLLNNEECLDLFMNALTLITKKNITALPSNDSCTMTYRSFNELDQPDVSRFCRQNLGQNK